MSVIGPRPQLVRDMVFMNDKQRIRHTAKPGLSGLAQVNGRNAISWEEKINWDLKYVENVSFVEDLKIIFSTVQKAFIKQEGITQEDMATAEDLGDYLLRNGKIESEEYGQKQKLAKMILNSSDGIEREKNLVSIVMPSYNTASYIEKSVQSVINQTYTNWELIIVDDCSTDNTDEVLSKIHDDRIRYFKNDKNSGAAVSRNKALREARGQGISFLAKLCIYLFFGLLIIVILIGGQGKFIVENGFQSLGKMLQNFIELSTFTDPGRTSNFPQDWTIYYWAYWMVWSVAAPFFIGNISRGRTIKQTILGGYVFGVGSTIVSFVVLGNYGLGLQTSGKADFIAQYVSDGDLYGLILSIIDTMPISKVILVITVLCMIAFYATSFDSIAYTAACYSYKQLGENEHPHKLIELLWCILLIVLPIALVFSESSMNNIQSISIISAFPIGIIMIIIIWGFFKDIKQFKNEKK